MTMIKLWLIVSAALGNGLIAGAFFVFSVAVMRALRRLPADHGARAMQSINLVILNPLFLGVFLGTAVISAILAVISVLNWSTAGSRFLLTGALFYLVGSFLVTGIFNVPLNNRLASAQPETDEGRAVWENYLTVWTNWNHVRTISSLAAMLMFLLSVIRWPGDGQ